MTSKGKMPKAAESGTFYREAVQRTSSLLLHARDRHIIWTPPDVSSPACLVFLADAHMGSEGTNYRAFRRDIQTLKRMKNTGLVIPGDFLDNHIKHPAATLKSALRPKYQWAWLVDFLSEMQDQIVAVISGNHEAWTFLLTDFDALSFLTDKLSIQYRADEAIIETRLRGQTYTTAVRHSYKRFKSTQNPCHQVKKWWEQGDVNFDVGCVAHDHVADVEPFVRHGVVRWAVRPGTYQTNGEFSKQIGYHGALAASPAVVFKPRVRDLHGFLHLDWADRAM